jgi:hypothetical protein
MTEVVDSADVVGWGLSSRFTDEDDDDDDGAGMDEEVEEEK